MMMNMLMIIIYSVFPDVLPDAVNTVDCIILHVKVILNTIYFFSRHVAEARM